MASREVGPAGSRTLDTRIVPKSSQSRTGPGSLFGVAPAGTCEREDGMSIEYDKDRTAALIKEAHDITDHLKIEIEGLRKQVACVLAGGNDPFTAALNCELQKISSHGITRRRNEGFCKGSG